MWKFGDNFPIIFDSSSDVLASKKVKIGNDVRFKIQLSFGEDYADIISMEAFLVNITMREQLKKEYGRINKFIGRFPIEPFKKEYEPTPYYINGCGKANYYFAAANMYKGYGVYPNWDKPDMHRMLSACVYRSEIEYTKDRHVVVITYPAQAQVYEGVYELVVVAKIHDSSYKGNIRTVSATFPGLFELVKDQSQATDNPIQIEIVNTDDTESLQDVYVIAGRYDNNSIHINRNDMGVVDIDVSPITQWYEGD